MQVSVNKIEAGCFFTSAILAGKTSAEALAELQRAEWHRPAHTATVRRLAKPLLARLDDIHRQSQIVAAQHALSRAAFFNLPSEVLAQIRELASDISCGKNKRKERNRAARDLCWEHGVRTHSIKTVRSFIAEYDRIGHG